MPTDSPTIAVAIFSYNRGAYLANCVASVERHLPGIPIWIFDDGSDDPHTRQILMEITARHKIIIADRHTDGLYLGGLHTNMNKALDHATATGVDYLYLIQDDQQFVRPCDDKFWHSCDLLFSSEPELVQISTLFFRAIRPQSYYLDLFDIHIDPPHYRRKGCSGIGDTGLIHVKRLVGGGFHFADSETVSGETAERLGFKAAHHAMPNLMFTPWPATIRPRSWKVAILVALNEWGVGAGCNPFHDMSPEAIQALTDRPLSEMPIAEHYLTTIKPLKTPWWYSEIFDLARLKNWKSLLTLRWIFDGPAEYRACVEVLKRSRP